MFLEVLYEESCYVVEGEDDAKKVFLQHLLLQSIKQLLILTAHGQVDKCSTFCCSGFIIGSGGMYPDSFIAISINH